MGKNDLETNINKTSTDFSYTQSKENSDFLKTTIDEDKLNISSLTVKTEDMTDLLLLPFIKKISLIAFPGMMFYLFLILLQTVNLIFIGKQYNNDDMIKGIGVSNLYMNCTMFAIIMGLVSGIDTLCANALGVKKYKLMGLYVHRARIIAYIATLIIVVVHLFTVEKVLMLFNLNDEVVKYSKQYIYVCLLYIFFDVQTACNFRYLNVIKKPHVNFVVLVIGGVLHPLWCYIFIVWLDLNVIGAGISFTISRFVICVGSSAYIHFWNPIPESYFCLNKSCFKGLWEYLKFSLGAAFLVCAEWWAFEIQAIIAISISEDDYTVHIILQQFMSILYSLSIGFSFAITIIVGEYIAKSTIKITKKATWFALGYGTGCMIFLLGIFYLFRDYMFRLFIDKENIIEKGNPVIPILCSCEFFDVIQTIMCSVFRGLGRQYSASILTFVQFYVVMTSLSYIFGKVLNWGVFGMWVGIDIGLATAAILYIIMFLCLDFEKIQKETKERLEKDSQNAKSFIEIDEAKLDADEDILRYMSFDNSANKDKDKDKDREREMDKEIDKNSDKQIF